MSRDYVNADVIRMAEQLEAQAAEQDAGPSPVQGAHLLWRAADHLRMAYAYLRCDPEQWRRNEGAEAAAAYQPPKEGEATGAPVVALPQEKEGNQ